VTPDAPRPLRVLVVEDEPVNRALLRAVLKSATSERLGGAEVREAETLAAARAIVGAWRPDVVILDVRLPDGNGLDLARELPPHDSGVRPAVLVMSASVQPSDRDAARLSGGDAFLGKPFLPADLLATLDRLAPGPAAD
jgi:two-component system KDP operon response regulator KdpE